MFFFTTFLSLLKVGQLAPECVFKRFHIAKKLNLFHHVCDDTSTGMLTLSFFYNFLNFHNQLRNVLCLEG